MDLPVLAPILIASSFLSGSIPFSLLVGKLKGVDIRKVGSGNPGATNLGRALGRKYFFIGFTLDMLKGLVPVVIAGLLLHTIGRFVSASAPTGVWLACAIAAVLGHVFTPWLKFKGGKGVATAFGALLGVFPVLTIVGVIALGIYLLCLWRTRIVSISSMLAGCSLPVTTALLLATRANDATAALTRDSGPWYLGLTLLLAALVLYTHRANIARLRAGTEPKIGQRVAANS
ncbi:MAG TPA: glycerol-3-phosphate 1-O-acyltransferase PlsY [Phycisphaerales bacterium]|nr:glycerol-3-phosphate 1-O-acyltransferase PlsY [Phycisphaerales bacterium]